MSTRGLAEVVPSELSPAVLRAALALHGAIVVRGLLTRPAAGALLDDVGRDVRYAFRLLARQRTFAAAIIGTLALGIGANTAIFSIIDGLLLRPLPVDDPERLV